MDGSSKPSLLLVQYAALLLQRLESQLLANKEMRNTVDEVCQKTKITIEPENS